MGHLLYGTSCEHYDEGSCHPYMRRTNWPTRTLMMQGNMGITNISELHEKLISRGQHPVFGTDIQTLMEEVGYYLDEGAGKRCGKFPNVFCNLFWRGFHGNHV